MRKLLIAAVVAVMVCGAGPARGAGWGVSGFSARPEVIARAERDMGKPFQIVSSYQKIDHPETFPTTNTQHGINTGALIYLNIMSVSPAVNGVQTAVCWADVAAGSHDSALAGWVAALKRVAYPKMLITFEHEPAAKGAGAERCAGDDADTYKLAFAHVHDYFKSHGVLYPWAFVSNAGPWEYHTIGPYIPWGKFSVLGEDGHNRIHPWVGPITLFGHAHDVAVNHRMAFFVAEAGCRPSPDRPTWYLNTINLLRSWKNFYGVIWTMTDEFTPYTDQPSIDAWLAQARRFS